MDKLYECIELLSGKFDNSDQLKQLQKEAITEVTASIRRESIQLIDTLLESLCTIR